MAGTAPAAQAVDPASATSLVLEGMRLPYHPGPSMSSLRCQQSGFCVVNERLFLSSALCTNNFRVQSRPRLVAAMHGCCEMEVRACPNRPLLQLCAPPGLRSYYAHLGSVDDSWFCLFQHLPSNIR